MGDLAITGIVVGVVGIVCFSGVLLTLGILAILYGRLFNSRATKDGVEVAMGPVSNTDENDKRTPELPNEFLQKKTETAVLDAATLPPVMTTPRTVLVSGLAPEVMVGTVADLGP